MRFSLQFFNQCLQWFYELRVIIANNDKVICIFKSCFSWSLFIRKNLFIRSVYHRLKISRMTCLKLRFIGFLSNFLIGKQMLCHCQKCVKGQLCAIARLLGCRLSSHCQAFNRRLNPICARPVIGRNKYLQCLAWFKRCDF